MKKLGVGLLMLVLLLLTVAAAETCAHHYENSDIPLKSGWWYRESDAGIEYRVYHKRICAICGNEDVTYKVIPDEEVPKGGVQTCPHVVRDYELLRAGDEDWVLEVADDVTGFSSAVCTLCNEDYLFYSGDPAGLVCNGRTHIFVRQPEVVEEGWASAGDHYSGFGGNAIFQGSWGHEYRKYYRAACVGCDAQLKCYVSDKNADGTLVRGEDHNYVEVTSYHQLNTNMHVSVVQCTVCGYTTSRESACNVYLNNLCEKEMKQAWKFYGLE